MVTSCLVQEVSSLGFPGSLPVFLLTFPRITEFTLTNVRWGSEPRQTVPISSAACVGSTQSQMLSLRMRSHAGVLPAARRQALALPVKQSQQLVRDVLVRVLSQSHDLEIGSKAPDFELLQV